MTILSPAGRAECWAKAITLQGFRNSETGEPQSLSKREKATIVEVCVGEVGRQLGPKRGRGCDFALYTPPACILKAKGGLHFADAYQCSHRGIHFIAWYDVAKMLQQIKSMGLALFTNHRHT